MTISLVILKTSRKICAKILCLYMNTNVPSLPPYTLKTEGIKWHAFQHKTGSEDMEKMNVISLLCFRGFGAL